MNNVIVILYDGTKPSVPAIETIVNHLVARGVINIDRGDPIVKHFDEESLAKLVVEKAVSVPLSTHEDANNAITAQLEQSCILIAEMFETCLPKTGDGGIAFMIAFHAALSAALDATKNHVATKKDIALVRAAKVITDNLENIPNAMISRTQLRKFALRIISSVYKKLT